MKISSRELATMLAALRNWQEIISPESGCDPKETAFEGCFDEHEPLTPDEIDELCERINIIEE